MTPYPMTAKAVAIAAIQAHAEGRLGYQRGHTDCLYRYPDGAVCAIGAALPDECVPEDQVGVDVEDLRHRRVISCAHNEIMKLASIQQHHDALCCPQIDNDGEFLKLLRKHAGAS